MDRFISEYLRKRDIDMDDYEFADKFKHLMAKHKRDSKYGDKFYEEDFKDNDYRGDIRMRRHNKSRDFMDMFDEEEFDDFSQYKDNEYKHKLKKYMRNSMMSEHLSEHEAMMLVAEMYHIENGRRYSGEKFDMHKAKEVCERYRGILQTSTSPVDVYVAINSQYHDYAELFKNWFGENIDQKVIESAIVFWFKDVDCKADNKVLKYFKEY